MDFMDVKKKQHGIQMNKQQHIKRLFQTCNHINGLLWKQHRLQNQLENKHHL
jgi:hypothetical protein